MHKQFAGIVTLLGRLLITPIFLIAGYRHITGFSQMQGAVAKGFGNIGITLPEWAQVLFLGIACVFLVAGGLMVLFGWQARLGALLLILFLLGVTPTLHAFWAMPAEQFDMQLIQFEKNLGLIGGLMFIMAYGPGPISADGARAERRK
jgi:putative oxidoreductase